MSAGTGLHPRRWGPVLQGFIIGLALTIMSGEAILSVDRDSRPHIVELGADPRTPLRLVDLERNPEAAPVPGPAVRAALEAVQAELAQRDGGDDAAGDA